ncbi:MAG: helix-turn-helix domain-containing protein, partial [Pseudomonadales bacterium]|nr:helix-turn-helix domain-containing protein [Pseudomonadales bacterium]
LNPVAKTIAAIRAQHSLTQQQLADMAGVPRATLANMESNGGNPTITTVIKIANALGVTVSDLVEKNQLTVATLVARKDMQSIRLDDGKFVSSQLSPINAPYILINEISMLPGCYSKGRPHPQGSHEFFYCLEGTALLQINDEPAEVEAGNVVYFAGNLPHNYINEGLKPVHAVAVVSIKDVIKTR